MKNEEKTLSFKTFSQDTQAKLKVLMAFHRELGKIRSISKLKWEDWRVNFKEQTKSIKT